MGPLLRASGGNAADVIRKEEGFRSKAYWDTNHYRVGFGSDTYVDEMGKVQEVTEDTVTTLDRANQDLMRRIGEFRATVQGQLGSDMFRSLTEAQQSALTSIAYNYGSLPASIVKAIKEGDQGKVATAISELSANPDRRKREAALFAGGSSVAGDALKAAEAYSKARENLTDYLATLDEQASLQERINEINKSGLSPDEKTTAIAVETELQKALNQAKRDGITLSEKDIALVREKAAANAAAGITADDITSAAKLQADALKDAQRASEDFQRATQAAVGGLIKDLIAGKDAAESFANALQKIADKAIDMAINSLFSMGGGAGVGGGGGGLLSVLGFHKGGIVGVDGDRRMVPASTFAGARRMHSGGIAGNEVPAILKRGEIVLPSAGSLRRGGSGGGSDTVNVRLHDDSGRMAEIADQRIKTASGTIVKVSVVQSAKAVQRQLPGMMANAQVRNG
jgi:GH24 family phage-related lysozyme (muramidase)